ncbi:MAG: methionyl-tRNA formyltransferase [Clostridia bacterium]|nr:methionyl-tRNA formyltransferase [Clostridia bacterium]
MNIIFMGTPDFAVESLKRIDEAGHHILAVVSQPDRKSGRGMNVVPTPVKIYAESRGIKVYQPERIRKDLALIENLKQMEPDLIVVVAFGQILPKSVLEIPKYGCINVHGSLLPKYRGAAPIQWSIINGDAVTGITTMYMDEGMDTGDMIEKFELSIEDSDTYGTLYEKMKVLGGKAIISTIEKIAEGKLIRNRQPEDFSIAPMIEKEMGFIDWRKTSVEIRNQIRGFNPAPGAYTFIGDEKIKVWMADILPVESDFSKVTMEPGKLITKSAKEGLIVKTGDGALKLTEIQFPNKSKMSAEDFLRGHQIEADAFRF